MRKKLYDLMNQRAAVLNAAETALTAENREEYNSQMEKLGNINADIERIQNLIQEQDRTFMASAPSASETRDMAEERCNDLTRGREIKFSADEILRMARNADGDGTLFSGTIAQPTGAGANVNDNIGECSVLDLVRVEDMTGLSGWQEPYAISDMTTAVGAPASTAGTARTKHDPTFGIAEIKPYEVTTTSYVDRNIRRLSPVAYVTKIQQMALRALRNKAAALIFNGDAENTHVMYGMINGTNKAGSSIIDTIAATVTASKGVVDVDLLDNLYFAYGDNNTVGGNGMIFLNKTDLKALGKLRGTNEKGKLFAVNPMTGDACRGTISDGGMIVPYMVCSSIQAIHGTSQPASTAADLMTCVYGDPTNYLLGLFGDYTVRIDESVKAVERLDTILGDMMIGGNVVANKGFVVAKIEKATT